MIFSLRIWIHLIWGDSGVAWNRRKVYLLPKEELDKWADCDNIRCLNCNTFSIAGHGGFWKLGRDFFDRSEKKYHNTRYTCRHCGASYAEEELTVLPEPWWNKEWAPESFL